MPPRLLFITTYSPQAQDLGGASWVDRRILARLRESFEVTVMTVADPASQDDLPLEVRSHKGKLAATLTRMVLLGEPYQEAKFVWSPKSGRVRDRIHAAAESFDLVATSQFPALLLAERAGLTLDMHFAHNVDWELSRHHDPALLRVLRNSSRLRSLEERLLSTPRRVYALSKTDVVRLREWGIYAEHLPLASRGERRAPSETRTVGLLGKMSWPPNAEAVDQLLTSIVPRVREASGRPVGVVLAGSGSEKYDDPRSGVVGMGRVGSLDEFYDRVDVVVVPRYGSTSGVSVKMLEAIEHGVDVIVPSRLAEDAGVPVEWVITADTPDEMVAGLTARLTGTRLDRMGEIRQGVLQYTDVTWQEPKAEASEPTVLPLSSAILENFARDDLAERIIPSDAQLLDVAFAGAGRVQTVNLHHLHLLGHNRRFAAAMRSAARVTADGWPVQVFCERGLGVATARVTGATFVENLVHDPRLPGRRIAVIGGSPDTVAAFAEAIRARGAQVTYTNTGRKNEWAPERIAGEITTAGGADIVLLAVTPPFGDIFGMELEAHLPGPFYINIGGGLAMFVGETSRAHPLVQSAGLEWVHRLLQNPRRLARRYLLDCPPVLVSMGRASRRTE